GDLSFFEHVKLLSGKNTNFTIDKLKLIIRPSTTAEKHCYQNSLKNKTLRYQCTKQLTLSFRQHKYGNIVFTLARLGTVKLNNILGLPFLNPIEVGHCFVGSFMATKSENNKINEVYDYLFFFPSARNLTTNTCENFHSELISNFCHHHPLIYSKYLHYICGRVTCGRHSYIKLRVKFPTGTIVREILIDNVNRYISCAALNERNDDDNIYDEKTPSGRSIRFCHITTVPARPTVVITARLTDSLDTRYKDEDLGDILSFPPLVVWRSEQTDVVLSFPISVDAHAKQNLVIGTSQLVVIIGIYLQHCEVHATADV
ncbi:hypothetical protein AGLY_015096, partial [Aphis glycines]